MTRPTERLASGLLRRLDAAATRLYGWRYHPFHQSGALAFWLLLVLIATGIYLLIFYRVSEPWDSVQRLQADPLLGRWMRSLHRYASDAMVIAVAAHALRMFAQARSWGPRTLAWISGVVLLLFVFVSGWTGFVMVWDTFGARLAIGGARLLDSLPVLSEPVQRIFAGDEPIPGAFFFINLFLHVAIPLAVAGGLWIHVSRLARPTLLPPRVLALTVLGGLTALSVLVPAPLPPAADPFVTPASVPFDLVYAFWLPWAERLPALAGWFGAVGTFVVAIAVPRLMRRPRTGVLAPSVVDERVCTGCLQCPQDCPWDAITMISRTDGRLTLVARVDPARCVSCGICAGSCAPMGVGPPLRTGRDQLAALRDETATWRPDGTMAPVAFVCESAAPRQLAALHEAGAMVRTVPCSGNVHSSVIELTLRAGAPGVVVFSCPPRDCRGREGPKWLEQRTYHDREAELQPRVDRRRVRLAFMAEGDLAGTLEAYHAFVHDLDAMDHPERMLDQEIEPVCDAVQYALPEEAR